MERFLIESPHLADDCNNALTQVLYLGYITHYNWGCKAGVHTGWAIIEADNESEALLTVPAYIRHEAKVTKLNVYTPDDFKKTHKK